MEELKKEGEENTKIQTLVQKYSETGEGLSGFTVKDDILYYKGRYYIDKEFNLIPKIMWEYHCSLLGGHAGYQRTKMRISKLFYWPRMGKMIYDYVRNCEVCQKMKPLS